MNYYVFRINYSYAYNKLRERIINGELRQGWGANGMTILQPENEFLDAWRKVWGDSDNDESYMRRKYHNIRLMLDMSAGDRIIIPKVSLTQDSGWHSFVIAERGEGKYTFSPMDDDFGHTIDITPIASYSYSHNAQSLTVSGKFKAYQKPVNRVYDEDFISAVEQLIKEKKDDPESDRRSDQTFLEALAASAREKKQAYLKALVDQINKWHPTKLEQIIEKLFTKNGYTKTASNQYNRTGGDIDLVFNSFVQNTLVADIFALSGEDSMPEIRVQAKKKPGLDRDDIKGVRQLAVMEGQENAINILINTTMDFSESAKRAAEEEGVVLINGMGFAALLVKYGLDIIES